MQMMQKQEVMGENVYISEKRLFFSSSHTGSKYRSLPCLPEDQANVKLFALFAWHL